MTAPPTVKSVKLLNVIITTKTKFNMFAAIAVFLCNSQSDVRIVFGFQMKSFQLQQNLLTR